MFFMYFRKTKQGFRDTSLEYLTIIYISMLHKTFGKIILSYRSVDVKELSEDIEKIVKDMWRLEQELAKVICFQNIFLHTQFAFHSANDDYTKSNMMVYSILYFYKYSKPDT